MQNPSKGIIFPWNARSCFIISFDPFRKLVNYPHMFLLCSAWSHYVFIRLFNFDCNTAFDPHKRKIKYYDVGSLIAGKNTPDCMPSRITAPCETTWWALNLSCQYCHLLLLRHLIKHDVIDRILYSQHSCELDHFLTLCIFRFVSPFSWLLPLSLKSLILPNFYAEKCNENINLRQSKECTLLLGNSLWIFDSGVKHTGGDRWRLFDSQLQFRYYLSRMRLSPNFQLLAALLILCTLFCLVEGKAGAIICQ